MIKKICLIGGEDVHKRIELSKYLVDAGFHVTIVGTSDADFPDSITYIPYNLNRSFSPISDYKTLKWFKHFFKNNPFDIIHTFDTKPAFLLPLALLKTKTPITRTITGMGGIFMSKSLLGYILRKVYIILHYIIRNRITKTVFQNSDDKNYFLNYGLVTPENLELIYSSGIELNNIETKAPRDNNIFTFICVSRLVYEKGIINLIEASKICKEKGHNFKCILVGPLEENSKRLNLDILKKNDDTIEWLGTRNDILELLSKSDAFILPTFYGEGFPRVLLEAAAVGLPLISTDTVGVREFGKHNKDIILLKPKDSISLADTMIMVATNKSTADKLANNAYNKVKEFSLEKLSKEYITIFNAAINYN